MNFFSNFSKNSREEKKRNSDDSTQFNLHSNVHE